MNKLFELKIRELKLLKEDFEVKNKILYIKQKNTKQVSVLGCEYCYKVDPEPTVNGYRIEIGELVNYYEKYREHITVPPDLAIKCWLCPHCNVLFTSLLPDIETLEVNNVGI